MIKSHCINAMTLFYCRIFNDDLSIAIGKRVYRAGIADITEHRAGLNTLTNGDMGESVQMGIVMPLAAGSEHPNHIAAQSVVAATHPR